MVLKLNQSENSLVVEVIHVVHIVLAQIPQIQCKLRYLAGFFLHY